MLARSMPRRRSHTDLAQEADYLKAFGDTAGVFREGKGQPRMLCARIQDTCGAMRFV